MSWQPPPRRRSKHAARKGLVLVVTLVAVNVGVVVYHGDPIARGVAEAAQKADSAAASTKPAAKQRPDEDTSPAKTSSLTVAPVMPAATAAVSEAAPSMALNVAPDENAGPSAQEPGMSDSLQPFDPTLGLRSPQRVQRVQTLVMGRNDTVAGLLQRSGIRHEEVNASIASLSGFVDFRRIRPGDRFKTRFGGNQELVSLEVRRGVLDQARTDLRSNGWKAARIEVPVTSMTAEVGGSVESSLWMSLVEKGGEDPRLVHHIVDVFAWEIDFYTEVYSGDTFRVLVEKRYAEGRFLEYGPILAAEYVSAGSRFRAFMHELAEGDIRYFDAEGQSLRKQLLKAPLKYAHVTSNFGKRRHPVLGYTRAHNGIDYGVPSGTPIWSVGDGRVTRAGRNGGYGNFISIRHTNGWVSQYAHLSKIGVKVGQRVAQKQNIGAVGSTGMSTGPHLHYELKREGRFVNPLSQKFERGKPLTGAALQAFKAQVQHFEQQLEGIHMAQRDQPAKSAEEG